jgi:hypothetical protein
MATAPLLENLKMKSRVRTAVAVLGIAVRPAALPHAVPTPTAQINSAYALVHFLPKLRQ